MVTKKYQLTRLHSLVTSFKTPSGVRIIVFEGGSRHHERKGYFITSDEELQKAIEESAGFNKDYKLAETFEDKTKEVEEVVAPIAKSYEDYLPYPAEVVRETSVTSLQKAKMWLQATHSKTFKGTSKEDIQREAAEVYNTLFVNWK